MAIAGANRATPAVFVVPVHPGSGPKALSHPAAIDRRREPRRCGFEEHGVHYARVRPGIDVRLLDVSAEGAAIETAYQLLPGRRLILQLTFANGAVAIRSCVSRCTVSHASAERVAYRGGLVFERRLRWIIDQSGVTGALMD
jgi:hypothetical protein